MTERRRRTLLPWIERVGPPRARKVRFWRHGQARLPKKSYPSSLRVSFRAWAKTAISGTASRPNTVEIKGVSIPYSTRTRNFVITTWSIPHKYIAIWNVLDPSLNFPTGSLIAGPADGSWIRALFRCGPEDAGQYVRSTNSVTSLCTGSLPISLQTTSIAHRFNDCWG